MARPLLSRRRLPKFAGIAVATIALLPLTASAQTDPRVGLAPGYLDWSEASHNVDLLDNDPREAPFDAAPGNFGFVNSDLAFSGTNAIVGNFNGFQVYDISDPVDPELRGSHVCPGGQGDVSVYGTLLFMSVEESRGRLDCGTVGAPTDPAQRFQGVRIFDISDIDNPVNLGGVQTCRGSHTHTLVADPDDPANVYVYVSGTAGVRSSGRSPARTRPSPLTPSPTRPRRSGASRSSRCRWPTRRRPPSSAVRASSPTT